MEAKDYLRMKIGSLISTRAHQGLYKNKTVFLRGFDFDETEIVDGDAGNIERLTNTTHMVDEIPLESCVT